MTNDFLRQAAARHAVALLAQTPINRNIEAAEEDGNQERIATARNSYDAAFLDRSQALEDIYRFNAESFDDAAVKLQAVIAEINDAGLISLDQSPNSLLVLLILRGLHNDLHMLALAQDASPRTDSR
jgi:hypothetical protein